MCVGAESHPLVPCPIQDLGRLGRDGDLFWTKPNVCLVADVQDFAEIVEEVARGVGADVHVVHQNFCLAVQLHLAE